MSRSGLIQAGKTGLRVKRCLQVLGTVAALAMGCASAAIDLSDFDDEVMRAMDDAFKDLEPVLGANNAATANSDVALLLEGYAWTEDYFNKKGSVDDGVKWSQQGRDLLAQTQAAITAGDFATAATTAREIAKNCKACHKVYKPLTK